MVMERLLLADIKLQRDVLKQENQYLKEQNEEAIKALTDYKIAYGNILAENVKLKRENLELHFERVESDDRKLQALRRFINAMSKEMPNVEILTEMGKALNNEEASKNVEGSQKLSGSKIVLEFRRSQRLEPTNGRHENPSNASEARDTNQFELSVIMEEADSADSAESSKFVLRARDWDPMESVNTMRAFVSSEPLSHASCLFPMLPKELDASENEASQDEFSGTMKEGDETGSATFVVKEHDWVLSKKVTTNHGRSSVFSPKESSSSLQLVIDLTESQSDENKDHPPGMMEQANELLSATLASQGDACATQGSMSMVRNSLLIGSTNVCSSSMELATSISQDEADEAASSLTASKEPDWVLEKGSVEGGSLSLTALHASYSYPSSVIDLTDSTRQDGQNNWLDVMEEAKGAASQPLASGEHDCVLPSTVTTRRVYLRKQPINEMDETPTVARGSCYEKRDGSPFKQLDMLSPLEVLDCCQSTLIGSENAPWTSSSFPLAAPLQESLCTVELQPKEDVFSTATKEKEVEEPKTGRPRRQCMPIDLKEPSLRCKMRNTKALKTKKKTKKKKLVLKRVC